MATLAGVGGRHINGYNCPRCRKPTVSFIERGDDVFVFCEDDQCNEHFSVSRQKFDKEFGDILNTKPRPNQNKNQNTWLSPNQNTRTIVRGGGTDNRRSERFRLPSADTKTLPSIGSKNTNSNTYPTVIRNSTDTDIMPRSYAPAGGGGAGAGGGDDRDRTHCVNCGAAISPDVYNIWPEGLCPKCRREYSLHCKNCGEPIGVGEFFETEPHGYCRKCRRTGQKWQREDSIRDAEIRRQEELMRQQPRPCKSCGKLVPADEYNRNHGYCDNCMFQRTAVNKAPGPLLIKCPRCGNDVDLKKTKKCPNCHYRIKPIRCPTCKRFIDGDSPSCPYCGWENQGYVKTSKNLKTATVKNVHGKAYEMIIYELLGVFVIAGLPFFGLPSLIFLGIDLMALFPLYSFLPGEHQALASKEQGVESLGRGWAAGSIVIKSMLKFLIFALAVWQFIGINLLISLAISFLYYIRLPSSYKTNKPSEMMEAWLKPVVGCFIAGLFLVVFSLSSQAWSLFYMALAFFCSALPEHRTVQENEESGSIRINVGLLNKYGEIGQTSQWGIIQKLIFVGFMLLAGFSSGMFYGVSAAASSLQLVFIAVWFLALITGLSAHPAARPAVGMLMILITLFVFTFTATGVMGQAVFGYWWPQVQSVGEAVFGPLGDVWGQVQSSMSNMWLLMTNPMAYMDLQNKQTQVKSSVITTGGTTKSIELTKTALFTSVNGELEPRLDPLIGSFEIQNQGEFEANRIDLALWATWTDPTKASATNPPAPVTTGSLDPCKFSCSQPSSSPTSSSCGSTPSAPPAPGSPSSSGQNTGICSWTNTTYPGEIKVINFMFVKDSWNLNEDNLDKCVDYNGTETACSGDKVTYKHSGQTVKVNVNLTYDYNVNVSIPVEVINQDKYRSLLESGGITLQQLTSQYTGGPVKATLWSQEQPVRSGELSLFVASIVNEGGGTLNQVYNFTVLIPKELADQGNIQIIAQTFENTANSYDGCGTIPTTGYLNPIDGSTIGFPNYWIINCTNNVPMKSGEYKRVSFFVNESDVIDRKTSLIIGLANYEYTKTGSASITVANAPWH